MTEKLTKDECVKALHGLYFSYGSDDRDDEFYDVLLKLINEHFDNPPLKFEELEDDKWYWHNKKKEWIKIISKGLCVPSQYSTIETIHEYMNFEQNCLYRKQVEE